MQQPTDDGATRDDDIVQRWRWRSQRGGTGSGPSTWNALGMTWEEKDATDWCTKMLERCLLNEPASSYFSELSSTACVASVKGVLDVKGDASVAIAGGKKWYVYDYHATVEYEIFDGGAQRWRTA
jgi:activator of HSP90 ATPase